MSRAGGFLSGAAKKASAAMTAQTNAAAAFALAQPLLAVRAAEASSGPSPLTIQREALLQDIRDIDHDFETGKLDEAEPLLREALAGLRATAAAAADGDFTASLASWSRAISAVSTNFCKSLVTTDGDITSGGVVVVVAAPAAESAAAPSAAPAASLFCSEAIIIPPDAPLTVLTSFQPFIVLGQNAFIN